MREKRRTGLRPLAGMFWLLTFLALFLLPGQVVMADTYVGGYITNDTTWNISESPYIVTDSLYINNDATLTIDPGVELQFDPLTVLQVGYFTTGTLIAEGTDEANIKFTSSLETPAPGSWFGVYFANLTGDGSLLKSSIVEYGGTGGFGNVHVLDSSPTIRECTIRHSFNFGVRAVNSLAEPELDCNTITANDIGIHVEGNAYPTIHDNDIRGNTTYGVRNIGTNTVIAEYNYWGASDGPSGEGSGSGDAVSANVDYDPFLTESAPCTVPLNVNFAADFGRTDCTGDCQGDFNGDGDVDGSDLAIFAAGFE